MKLAIVTVVALAVAPSALSGFQVTLLTELLIFALFAMSLDIQVGYARMFSFGHAAPYGVAAYVTAFALLYGDCSLPVAMLLAVTAVFAMSIPIGWLCTRASGVAFAMLTLAFAQLTFAVIFKWNSMTGGSDGLSGLIRRAGPFGFDGFASREGYYWLTLAIVIGVTILAQSFVRSPMGTAIVAVRENERRTRAIGYDPRTLRLAAYIVSNTVAGVAGTLHAGFLLFVSPELLHWTLSGYVLVAVVLGGAGTLIGPMLGAALMITASHQISTVTDSWPLFMGLLFMFVVVAAPNGLWGFREKIESVFRRKEFARSERNNDRP